jgi:hypothetical protein
MKFSRLEIANALKLAGSMHFAKRGYAVNQELGLLKRGKLRADLFCLSFKNTVIVEIKSCFDDFKADNKVEKWKGYLKYANQFYFLSTLATIKKIEPFIAPNSEVGLLYLCSKTGHIKTFKKSKKTSVEESVNINLIYRCAYRGAKYTKRNLKRYKVFIDDNST